MKKNTKFYIKKLTTGSLALSISSAAQKLVGFFLLPIFTHYLSPEDFGIISVITLITSSMGLLYNPGINSACQRLYYDYDSDRDRQEIIGTGFLFLIFFPLFLIVIILPFGKSISGNVFSNFPYYPYGVFALILSLFTQPKRMWSVLLSIQYNIKRVAFFVFLSFLLSLTTSLVLVVGYKMGVYGRVIGMLVGPLALFTVVLKDVIAYTRFKFSFKKFKEILQLGFPLIIAIWAYSILHLTDRYMIERLTDLSSLGFYSVALKISTIPMIMSVGLRQMWTPIFYDNMKNENYETIKKLMSLFIIGMTFICIFIIIFCKELILCFLDDRYYKTIEIVPWIILGVLFLGLLPLSNSFIGYQKKFKYTSLISFIAAILNIFLNYILINKMGVKGAAIATTISYSVYFFISVFVTFNDFKKVFDKKLGLIIPILIGSSMILTILFHGFEIDMLEILIKIIASLMLVSTPIVFKIVSFKQLSQIPSIIVKRKKSECD